MYAAQAVYVASLATGDAVKKELAVQHHVAADQEPKCCPVQAPACPAPACVTETVRTHSDRVRSGNRGVFRRVWRS